MVIPSRKSEIKEPVVVPNEFWPNPDWVDRVEKPKNIVADINTGQVYWLEGWCVHGCKDIKEFWPVEYDGRTQNCVRECPHCSRREFYTFCAGLWRPFIPSDGYEILDGLPEKKVDEWNKESNRCRQIYKQWGPYRSSQLNLNAIYTVQQPMRRRGCRRAYE